MASIVPRMPRRKLRGRPKNSGTPKDPYLKSTVPFRVSQQLVDTIEPELRPNESYSDAILRLLAEKGIRIAKAQKKVEALQEQFREHLLEIESLTQYEYPVLNNLCIINCQL
jgi:hypothetical protein